MQGKWPFTQISGANRRACDVDAQATDHVGARRSIFPVRAALFQTGSTQWDALNIKAERLSGKHSGLVGADSRPMMLVGRTKSFAEIRYWLEHDRQDIDSRHGIGEAVHDLESGSETWSYVLVNIDDFGGIDDAIEALLLLRRAAGKCPVILLSSETVLDDLSSERLVLCDATLRLPLSLTRFEVGLVQAIFNNNVWQNRKLKLRLTDSAICA